MIRRASVVLVVSLVLSFAARGDTLHLKNGGKFEGQVVSETADSVVFKIRGLGPQTFERSDILRIEKGESIFDEYEARRAEVAGEDADGFYELGRWCMENGLRQEARKAWRSGIAADGEHAELRRALGYTKVRDRWMDRRQLRRYRAKRRKEIEAALGTLELGRLVKDRENQVAFRPPRSWKADTAEGGLAVVYRGPELHGVELLIGYELLVLSEPPEVQEDVRRSLEDEEGFEPVREDVPSSIGGLLARESVCRYGPADARVERHDLCFARGDDVVHVWFRGPAEDWEALRPIWAEITGSFRLEDIGAEDGGTGGRPFTYELPGPDWSKGFGAAAEMGLGEVDLSEPGVTAEVIGHDINPTLIFMVAQDAEETGNVAPDDFLDEFVREMGATMGGFRALTAERSRRQVAGCRASMMPFRANIGRAPVQGHVCVFGTDDRMFVVLALNLFASMGDKYLREDLGKLLDSMKVQ